MFHICDSIYSVLILCALSLSGCFDSSAEKIERAKVSGIVTLDGMPLPEGSIQFIPDVDSSGKRVRGKAVLAIISQGIYSLNAVQGPTVGPNKILINASQKTGKFQELDGEKIEILKQYLPAKYNSESTLKYAVKSGENNASFTLDSE